MGANTTANNFSAGRSNGLPPESVIFGCSPAMRSVRQKTEKVWATNVPLLIQGENGTGKEVLAGLIHARSPWSSGPFVKVNCAAIPGTLLESELFGYQKGAFTGAYSSKPGRVEMAHRGTLFLNEIAELDPSLQAKLLQLLQDGHFCRIGDQEDKRVECRVICATNRQLEREIEAGSFRPDLFYRINVINIYMPRLRERREDIALLAGYFLSHFNNAFQRNSPPFSKGMIELLEQRSWPGNIRELANWIARYVILGPEEALCAEPFERSSAPLVVDIPKDGTIPLKHIAKQATREVERNLILKVLQDNHWNRRKAAQILSISYRALSYKIRQAGLAPRRARHRTATANLHPEQPPPASD